MQDIPDRRQEIDDIVKTKDIFINDDLFSDTDTRDTCNLVDQIKSEADVNDVLLEHEPVDTTPDIPPSAEPLLDFSDILLKSNKRKNKTAKKIIQKYKNIRQNKDKINPICHGVHLTFVVMVDSATPPLSLCSLD